MQINILELLSSFDERPPSSIGHATAIVSVIGEDLVVALLQECLMEEMGVIAKVIMNGERPWTPTLGTGRGFRLDRWLLTDAMPPTLYQVEIKNWSAHAIGGSDIPSEKANDKEFLKDYRSARWRETWDLSGNCFRWGQCGKVLTRMAVPNVVEQGTLVEPILCFWWPIHPEGKDESLFCYPLPSVPESGFTRVMMFSASNYLRSLDETKIELEIPSAAQRIDWLRRLLPCRTD